MSFAYPPPPPHQPTPYYPPDNMTSSHYNMTSSLTSTPTPMYSTYHHQPNTQSYNPYQWDYVMQKNIKSEYIPNGLELDYLPQPQIQYPDANVKTQYNNGTSNEIKRTSPTIQNPPEPVKQTEQSQNIETNEQSNKPEPENSKKRRSPSDDTDDNSSENGENSTENPAKKPYILPGETPEDTVERRKRNATSAKKCRETRRNKGEQMAMRLIYLEQENLQLKTELSLLTSDVEKLKYMLYNPDMLKC